MSGGPFYNKNKVDYSRYSYKNYLAYYNSTLNDNATYDESGKEENANKTNSAGQEVKMEDINKTTSTEKHTISKEHKDIKKEKNKPKSSKGLFAIIMILLCFLITVVSANLITNGYLVEELFAFKNIDNKISYYALVGKAYNTREDALPESILIRQGGGCSYVLEENQKYYVIYSVYLNKDDAKSVQNKNNGTEIIQLNVKKIDYQKLDAPLVSEIESISAIFENTINEMYALSIMLEKKEINFFDAQIKLGQIKSPLIVLKQNLYNNTSLKKNEKDFLLLQIEVVLGAIDSVIEGSATTFSILSDVRYIQAHTVRVYQNLFVYLPKS